MNVWAFLIQLLVTAGLTKWVYDTLKSSFQNTIDDLRFKIENMERELLLLKQSESKWYRKYHKLLLITKKACADKNCPINREVEKHLAEEGEV